MHGAAYIMRYMHVHVHVHVHDNIPHLVFFMLMVHNSVHMVTRNSQIALNAWRVNCMQS